MNGRCLLLAIWFLSGCGFAAALADEAPIKVVIDDKYMQPPIQFSPTHDSHGLKPHDVIVMFWADIEQQDDSGARSVCLLRNKESQWKGIADNEFPRFCRELKSNVRSIVLSSAAINDKGYWGVPYKITTANGDVVENRAYVKLIDNEWKIIETRAWQEIARGKLEKFYW